MKLSIFASILLVVVFILVPVHSAQSAEIININYKYKIAFADLTENDVKPGEVVTVITPDGVKAPLKVVETYPVMVKLTVTDGEGALTDDQFALIPVGSQVVPGGRAGKAARGNRIPDKTTKAPGGDTDDALSHVESYSPNVPSSSVSKEPTDEPRPERPSNGANTVSRTSATTSSDASLAGSASAAGQSRSESARCAGLDQRLDQMLTNNVKLTENLTQFLTEKNAAESRARDKEAEAVAARAKADELVTANAALMSRVKTLEASVAAAEGDKAAKQKEIDNLNLKLGELKKKLAKMVEIVNTNMKAYEK